MTRSVKRKQPAPAAAPPSAGEDGGGSERDWHALFDQMDADGCGSISWAELHLWTKTHGMGLSPTDLDEMFRMCDEDGDHQISFPEFMTAVKDQGFHQWQIAASIKPTHDALLKEVRARRAFDELVEVSPVFATRWLYDDEAKVWTDRLVEVQLAEDFFIKGGMRRCFAMKLRVAQRGTPRTQWKEYLAKDYLSVAEDSVAQQHAKLKGDVRMQARVARLSRDFNQLRPPPPKKIDVLEVSIVVPQAGPKKGRTFFAEAYVPSAYIKHSNNYGFVGLDVQGDEALSRTRSGTLNKTSSEVLSGEDGAQDVDDAGTSGPALELIEMRQTPHAFSYFTV